MSAYKCPHCSRVNEVNEKNFSESFSENLPSALANCAIGLVAGALTGGLGALIWGGKCLADGAIGYANGTKITCGNCKNVFKI